MRIDKSNIDQFINGTHLDCSSNGITSIEDIPDHITSISCWNNKLTSLPKLSSGLTYLSCGINNLNSLPILPDSLIKLYCSNNNLNSYPNNPSDKQWMLNHNKLLHRSTIINKINDYQ